MTYLLAFDPQKQNKTQKHTKNRVEIMKNKSKYIAPHQRKKLSYYKLKKQTAAIEQILSDAFLKNI